MALTTFPVLIAAVLAIPFGYVVYQLFFHPLSSIPGPFWARLSRLWMVKHGWDGDMHTTMLALHKNNGPLVRTGPDEVSVSAPSAIKTIYGAGSTFAKSRWYASGSGRKFDMFGEQNIRTHAEQRRLITRPYSMDMMRSLEPYTTDAVNLFMKQMEKRSGQVVDLGEWLQLYAFDVIGEVTFSRRFGFIDSGKHDGTFETLRQMMRSLAWVGQVPFVHDFQVAVKPYVGNFLAATNRTSKLKDYAAKEVNERKQRGSDHKDIITQLMAIQKEKPHFDDESIVSMATGGIAAGSDTTAIEMRAIVYYLLRNPSCKAKLVAEIDAHRANGTLSDPVTLSEANNLPYLQAVMYEAMRLHPAVGMALPRVVPAGGVTLLDHYIPGGAIVGVNAHVVHRDEEIFGPDVETFRPERWINKDGSRNEDMHRCFFAFGGGARVCLGRNIAWLEMSKLIPTLFLHYDLQLDMPDGEWETRAWFVTFQFGLNVRLVPRVKC